MKNRHHMFSSKIILGVMVGVLVVLTSCGESERLTELRMEITQAEEVNAQLIEESKAAGYKVSQELQRSLEGHAILFLEYYQRGGDIDIEMTGKLIKYMEYYRENADSTTTDPGYQGYLPMLYGIQAYLYGDDLILATENTKQSFRGFEELLEDYPDDPVLNIYYTIILGAVPSIFKTEKKAWEYHLKVDKMLTENGWEESVPRGLREKLYSRAAELAEELDPQSDKADYFKMKLKNLENIPE